MFSRSALLFYSIYTIMPCALQNRCAKYVIRTFQKKANEKSRNFNYLKWKKWMILFLEKGSSPQYKGNFVWQKGTWVIKKEVKCEVEYPPHRKLIFSLFNQIKRKLFFQKQHFLTMLLIPRCIIYLEWSLQF